MRCFSRRIRISLAAAILMSNLLTVQAFARNSAAESPRLIDRIVRFLRHRFTALDQISVPPG